MTGRAQRGQRRFPEQQGNRSIADHAAEMTRLALARQSPDLARAALALRAEARLHAAMRAAPFPSIEGDAGASGHGRGPVEAVDVATMTYSARKGDWVPTLDRATRRALSRTLDSLPPDEQRAALTYEALVAQRGAIACIDPASQSAAPSGVSDGGAAHRWDRDAALTRIEQAIGTSTALPVRYRCRHPDRGQRVAISVRVLTDAVCLHGRSIDDVLARHGWSRNRSIRDQLREALLAALRRVAAVI